MALVAGGRRAATSYDRLIEWADVDDADLYGFEVPCHGACGTWHANEYFSVTEALPQVGSSERSIGVGAGVVLPSGQAHIVPTFTPVVIGLNLINRDPFTGMNIKVLDGELFSLTAPNEALITFDVAERFDLVVGDHLGIIVSYEEMTTADVEITGIIAFPGVFPSFSGPVDPVVILPPAFLERHPELIDWTNASLSVKLRDGVSIEEFRTAVFDADIPDPEAISSTREQADGPRQLMRFDAGVLWLLAIVVGLGSVVVIAQMSRRAATTVTPELNALRALGMRRADLLAAAVQNGLRTGIAGLMVGAVVAVGASPLFPVGISRTAEPHPGLSIDYVVLGIGAIATLLLTTLTAGVANLLATRHTSNRDRRYAIASLATRLPPASASGVRLALTPSSSGTGATLRIGLLGLASILAILVSASALTASLDHAIATPVLTGGTWDGALIFEDPGARAVAGESLANDPRVESYALGGWTFLTVNGRSVFTQVLDTETGIDIATDRGRGPRGTAEIVLGELELDALGVGVGDAVQVQLEGGEAQTATVVGRAVLASTRYKQLLQGEGAAVTPGFMARLGDEQSTFAYVVQLRDDSQVNVSIQELASDLDANFSFPRPDRAGVKSLRSVRGPINAVLVVVGLLAVAALLHRLIVTSRSQRRQIAVLRAIGLTGRQVLSAGATLGLVVATLASMVAIPVGGVGGVIGWRAIADYLGVIPAPVVPAAMVLVFLGLLVALGLLTGLAVVERVRRQRPGMLLRAE